jgi:hypothetical protein
VRIEADPSSGVETPDERRGAGSPQGAEGADRFVETRPSLGEINADRIEDPGPTATTSRPWLSRSMAARVLASGTGPRITGSDTVVASVIVPEWPITAASVVSPSSHGTEKTMWSLVARALKPTRAAVWVYATRCSRV